MGMPFRVEKRESLFQRGGPYSVNASERLTEAPDGRLLLMVGRVGGTSRLDIVANRVGEGAVTSPRGE